MPTFRNQMSVRCNLSFAEWNNQLRVLRNAASIPKWGPEPKPLENSHYLGRVLYYNVLFGDQIHDCGRTFLFGKLTCKFPTAWKMSKYGVFSGPYFPVFGLNTEIYFVNLQIRSECRKRGTRKKPVFGHFWHTSVLHVLQLLKCINPSSFQLDWQPMFSP